MPIRRQPSIDRRKKFFRCAVGLLTGVALLTCVVAPSPVHASAVHPVLVSAAFRAQTSADWLSTESAARLDLGFPVAVPSFVPAPFSGEPSVYASAGYYSLYWVIYGGSPTFLEIRGEVGGAIPAGSAYDLNVQLVANSTVQGIPAYRDLTPIYDTVWWQSGGVVYMVTSRGLAGTDSLAIANSLGTLTQVDLPSEGDPPSQQPATEVPVLPSPDVDDLEQTDSAAIPAANAIVVAPDVVVSGEVTSIAVEGTTGANLVADGGIFTDTGGTTFKDAGGFAVEWQAPVVDMDQSVSFVLVNPISGDWLATTSTQVLASGESGIAADPDGVAGVGGVAPTGEEGDGTGSPAPAPVPAGFATSNLTGSIAMSCPTVAYSGRLMPIKLTGTTPAIVNATLGGWPDEPGNRAFDPDANGGPALVGGVARSEVTFIHWRAPTVTDVTESRFFLTHPDGTALAECVVQLRPGEPPARRPQPTIGELPDHDGTGGPFPFRTLAEASLNDDDIGISTLTPAESTGEGDGTQGPIPVATDGTGGMQPPGAEGDGSGGPRFVDGRSV